MTAGLDPVGAGQPASLAAGAGGLMTGEAAGTAAGLRGGTSGPAGGLATEPAGAGGQLVRASLSETTAPGQDLSSGPGQDLTPGAANGLAFDFNPERITVSHTPKIKTGVVGSLSDQITSLGDTEIGIDKIIFIGPRTQSSCEKLLGWSFPPVDESGSGEAHTEAIWLQFSWGTAFSYTVHIRSVTVMYLRFASDGTPTRAEVGLKLYQPNGKGKPAPSANPTSGGPPGRSTRVLDSSGCLASLAYATYDRPGAWRLIAHANGIDDPLRVRPGTVLYLPRRGELSNGAGSAR